MWLVTRWRSFRFSFSSCRLRRRRRRRRRWRPSASTCPKICPNFCPDRCWPTFSEIRTSGLWRRSAAGFRSPRRCRRRCRRRSSSLCSCRGSFWRRCWSSSEKLEHLKSLWRDLSDKKRNNISFAHQTCSFCHWGYISKYRSRILPFCVFTGTTQINVALIWVKCCHLTINVWWRPSHLILCQLEKGLYQLSGGLPMTTTT